MQNTNTNFRISVIICTYILWRKKERSFFGYTLSLTLMLLFLVSLVRGQSVMNDSTVFKSGWNGGSSIGYYSGQSGYSIPLFNLKTKGVSVPVSIVYNSQGFKPNSPEGKSGLNWTLMAQGMITRKVNNIPDEQNEACSYGFPKGFYVGTRYNSSSMDAQIYNASTTFSDVCGYYNPGFEYSPDEFSFNCLGHSGKFYITHGGNVRVVSNEDIKVDLSNLGLQSVTSYEPVSSTIILTTSDGYKFTFGGDPKNLDFSYAMPDKDHVYAGCTVNVWHLVKVTTPDNNEIRYVYKNYYSGGINNVQIDRQNTNQYELVSFINSVDNSDVTDFNGHQVPFNDVPHNKDAFRLTKLSQLDKIESDDFSLNFSYSADTYAFYQNSSHVADGGNFNRMGTKLDAITLYNKELTEIKRYQFTYQDLGSTYGTRKFLTSMTETGRGTYTFNYYRTNEIPGSHVRNIDHWFFWKGGYSESAVLIPGLSQASNGDQTITSTLRDPDGSYCNVAMLKSVIYPTGGSTSFIYEPHDYAKRLERRASNSFLPALFSVAGIAGGARIKSIKDSSAVANIITRNFTYKKDFMTGGTSSSGLLLDWPRYMYDIYFSAFGYNVQWYRKSGTSYNLNYNTNEPFVNYSEVTEEIAGNGYQVMKFSNYETRPDVSAYNNRIFSIKYPLSINLPALYDNYHGYPMSDVSEARGRLIYEGYFDSNKSLIKYQTTDYNSTTFYDDYIIATKNGLGNLQAYKIYITPCRPGTITTVTNSVPATVENQYVIYDSQFHNTHTIRKISSDGNLMSRWFTYANDYLPGTAFIDNMVTAGMTGLPIEEVIGKAVNITGGKVTQYFTGGKGRPQTILNLEINAPVPNSNFKPSNHLTGELPGGGGAAPRAYSIDSRYQPAFNFTQYDNYGHPVETVPNLLSKGSPSTAKYGYNGQYVIAATNNAKLNEVYFENFEELIPAPYDSNSGYSPIVRHTGKNAGAIVNTGSGELYSHSTSNLTITSGTARKFTYSGWIYNSGPANSEIFLFMYKAGETGYYTYFDNIQCNQTGKWVYVSKTVTVPADVVKLGLRLDCNSAGDSYFDDLCIRPADAKISSYTYQPFVGLTSKIDENNQTTYYEYDDFKRLKNVKDQNGFIRQNYQYNFKH